MNERHPPIGIYKTLKDWINSELEQDLYKSTYFQIYTPSPFKRRINNPPAKYPKITEGGYVGIIPKGRVWGHNGAIITPDNKLVWDVSLEYVSKTTEHSIFKVGELSPVTNIYDTVADLTHCGSKNYYHWMFETIPRIHLLQESGVPYEKVIIKGDEEYIPFQFETLSILGISKENIIVTHKDFHIKSESLIVPSQPMWPTKWAFDYLRKVFIKEVKSKKTKRYRIYICRKGTRRIINEDELIDQLKKYDFLIVELENMSVMEQVRLFSSAEIVIAPHGAGLTNLTFCHPGTKVLEIFPPTFIHCYYWLISSYGNLNYHFLIGDYGERDTELLQYEWHGYDNLFVNLDQIKFILTKFEI